MSNNIFEGEQEESIDVLGILRKYVRYWYWFALALAISLGWAYFHLRSFVPLYQVKTTLLIKDDYSSRGRDDIKEEFSIKEPKTIDNEMEVLKSRPLIGKVVDKLNLTVSYWKEGNVLDQELHTDSPIKVNVSEFNDFAYSEPLYVNMGQNGKFSLSDAKKNNLGTYEYSQLLKTPYGNLRIFKNDSVTTSLQEPIKVRFHNREGQIGNLIGSLQIAPTKEYYSSIISIVLTTTLPKKGNDILETLLEEYAFNTLEDKNREATNTLRFIEERLKIVTAELGDVEQNIERFKRNKGVTDVSSQAGLFLSKVEDNDAKLNQLEITENVLDQVENYLNSTQVGNIAPAISLVSDPMLSSYITQYLQLENERSKLAQTVQTGNPYLETVNNQMRNVKQAIRENLSNQRANIQITKRSIYSLNNRLESAMSAIPQKEREFVGIKRLAGIKENLYLLLLQKREETALSYAKTVTDSRVIEAPFFIGQIAPNTQKTYMMAILLALAIPAIVIAVRELLTGTVQSKSEIEKTTGLSVFGEIAINKKKNKEEILDLKHRSFTSEQIRMIRSNLQYLFTKVEGHHARTILFTSSISGEGKSFIAANIAASLTLINKKVVLLAFDMRKPKIHEYVKVENTVGLSNYLIGKAKYEEIIRETAYENLFIITSGKNPPNPSELIDNGNFESLFRELQADFDYIIIDTPPVGLVTDASLLAKYADVSFYVIRHEFTPKMHLNTIRDLAKRSVFPSLHILFNGVNYKNSYEHGYGYTRGYGYYAEAEGDSWKQKLKNRLS